MRDYSVLLNVSSGEEKVTFLCEEQRGDLSVRWTRAPCPFHREGWQQLHDIYSC